jgi:hypothetical protein
MKPRRIWTATFMVLAEPQRAITRALATPRPGHLLAAFALAGLVLGMGTLPRQLGLLDRALAPGAAGTAAPQIGALAAGLTRLMVVDRLVPLPTVPVAAILLFLAAEPVLMLAASRRRELLVVIVLGLAPLLVLRLGELAMTWLVDVGGTLPPGEVLRLPHRFASGAVLFWRRGGPPPAALEVLEARVNLFSLWSLGLWAVGLAQLESRGVRAWHVCLPAACLAGAGVLTWVAGPIVLAGVLALGGQP